MKIKNCSHPNCKCIAAKQRPGDETKWLCEIHYSEIISAMKTPLKPITLTCPNDSK
jgi:hypothetical protein